MCGGTKKVGCEEIEDCFDFKMATLIDLNYIEYAAKEIHFKTPAEHKINEDNFDMEI